MAETLKDWCERHPDWSELIGWSRETDCDARDTANSDRRQAEAEELIAVIDSELALLPHAEAPPTPFTEQELHLLIEACTLHRQKFTNGYAMTLLQDKLRDLRAQQRANFAVDPVVRAPHLPPTRD